MTERDRTTLAALLRGQAEFNRRTGSPFYAGLMEKMAEDVDAGGPVAVLAHPDVADFGAAYRLRLLGGVHRMVLAGDAPELVRHFPSTAGDGDADAAWPHVATLFENPPPALVDALARPPQTNEVARSSALVCGLLLVQRESGLPLRLLELGSSAGLNLRVDRYWFESDGRGVGDPASPVRFVDVWDGVPPFDAPLEVATRRGCDRDPVDPTTHDGRLTLLSYVWPDQSTRLELLRNALDVARRVPVAVDRADIPAWLAEQVREPVPGTATVVFHSIVWGYLTDDERARAEATLADAGGRARAEAPLAWLRLEPARDDIGHTELRLTTWPGGHERVLAEATYHVGRVRWLGA